MGKAKTVETEISYYKEQLVSSKRLAKYKDLCSVLLQDNRLYTFSEVEAKIENYLKGVVK